MFDRALNTPLDRLLTSCQVWRKQVKALWPSCFIDLGLETNASGKKRYKPWK